MKNFILGALMALIAAGCASAPADAVLTFDVTSPTAKEIVLVCNTDIKTFPLDESGHCEAVLENVDAIYARMFYGRNERIIYVEGGDHASISFDAGDFEGTFRFDGAKAPAVEYLRNVDLTPLPAET